MASLRLHLELKLRKAQEEQQAAIDFLLSQVAAGARAENTVQLELLLADLHWEKKATTMPTPTSTTTIPVVWKDKKCFR